MLLYAVQKISHRSERAGIGRTTDLDVRKTRTQVTGRCNIKLIELFQCPRPCTRIRKLTAFLHIQIRFIPYLPVLDIIMESVCPSLVIMSDDVFADPGPLHIVLRRVYAIFFRAMLDGQAEAVERFGSCIYHIGNEHISVHEIIRRRIIHRSAPIREHRIDVHTMLCDIYLSEGCIMSAGTPSEGRPRFSSGRQRKVAPAEI